MIHLDHRDSRPIYDQIADNFRRQIRSGVLRCGDKLPSVRELSAQLTINPNTIQKAYAELERQGFIYTVKGRGNFVSGSEMLLIERRESCLKQILALVKEAMEYGISREEILAEIAKGVEGV